MLLKVMEAREKGIIYLIDTGGLRMLHALSSIMLMFATEDMLAQIR